MEKYSNHKIQAESPVELDIQKKKWDGMGNEFILPAL